MTGRSSHPWRFSKRHGMWDLAWEPDERTGLQHATIVADPAGEVTMGADDHLALGLVLVERENPGGDLACGKDYPGPDPRAAVAIVGADRDACERGGAAGEWSSVGTLGYETRPAW